MTSAPSLNGIYRRQRTEGLVADTRARRRPGWSARRRYAEGVRLAASGETTLAPLGGRVGDIVPRPWPRRGVDQRTTVVTPASGRCRCSTWPRRPSTLSTKASYTPNPAYRRLLARTAGLAVIGAGNQRALGGGVQIGVVEHERRVAANSGTPMSWAHSAISWRPISVEPVKVSLRARSGCWSARRRLAALPVFTLNTPFQCRRALPVRQGPERNTGSAKQA